MSKKLPIPKHLINHLVVEGDADERQVHATCNAPVEARSTRFPTSGMRTNSRMTKPSVRLNTRIHSTCLSMRSARIVRTGYWYSTRTSTGGTALLWGMEFCKKERHPMSTGIVRNASPEPTPSVSPSDRKGQPITSPKLGLRTTRPIGWRPSNRSRSEPDAARAISRTRRG